ncbi:MAG: hypothetical protein WBA07_29125 [Rivularia sp. (in: cyanobacteria)]
MVSNLLQKVLVSTTVGAVVGFSSIFGAMSSAAALTVESESYNKNGKQQDISHIVFDLKDKNSGETITVKIDSVDSGTTYDATDFLSTYYPNAEVVGSHVKSSNNEVLKVDISHNYNKEVSLMTPIKEGGDKQANDKENKATKSPKAGKKNNQDNTSDNEEPISDTQPGEQPAPTQTEDTTSSNEESQPSAPPKFVVAAPPQTNSSTEPVSVPEPGSMAAIVIFGLSGLLGKKKISS